MSRIPTETQAAARVVRHQFGDFPSCVMFPAALLDRDILVLLVIVADVIVNELCLCQERYRRRVAVQRPINIRIPLGWAGPVARKAVAITRAPTTEAYALAALESAPETASAPCRSVSESGRGSIVWSA